MVDNNLQNKSQLPKPEVKNQPVIDETQKNRTEEVLEKEKLSQATAKVASNENKERLQRVDEYIEHVEQGAVKKLSEEQQVDIEMAEDKEVKLRHLEEAMKNNLTGYDLEKEI